MTETTWRRVLAIDTATRVQSLALLDGDTVVEHSGRRVRFNHGSTLLTHVSATLDANDLQVDDLDLIAIGRGPGSFTGLRVGLAIGKSLARAKDVPIVGVSTLAALSYPVAASHRAATICAAFDARRGEVYAGLYTFESPELRSVRTDHAADPADLRETIVELASDARPVVVLGDGARAYQTLAEWPSGSVTSMPMWADGPSATAVALLGRQAARRNQLADLRTLEPNYIRPTDAEMSHT